MQLIFEEFKLNLFSKEIFVFTPNGNKNTSKRCFCSRFCIRYSLSIRSKLFGCKVNGKIIPLSHKLRSGDQVEVISSEKQKPKKSCKLCDHCQSKKQNKEFIERWKKMIANDGKEILKEN